MEKLHKNLATYFWNTEELEDKIFEYILRYILQEACFKNLNLIVMALEISLDTNH